MQEIPEREMPWMQGEREGIMVQDTPMLYGKGIHTCAECEKDVKECKIHNNFVGKLFAFLFNSDRAACIHYIREHGEESFAKKMTEDKQMTMKKR